MKRIILTAILAVATGIAALAAPQAAQGQATPGQGGPKPKSAGERDAILAVQTAGQKNDPDAMIKAADNLVTKYTDTEYKEWALSIEASGYQMKGDSEHSQAYAEQALEVNPKAYTMLLLVGENIAGHMGDHDLDRDQKIKTATKDFKDTIEYVNLAPKPSPQTTDAQWADFKKHTVAEAHNGLGVVALQLKDWDTAIAEFKLAVDGDPQDAYYTRLASVYQSSGKNDEAIAICDKLLANPSLHPTIKRVVEGIRANAVKAKAK